MRVRALAAHCLLEPRSSDLPELWLSMTPGIRDIDPAAPASFVIARRSPVPAFQFKSDTTVIRSSVAGPPCVKPLPSGARRKP